MPIRLTPAEKRTAEAFARVKEKSGSHSPSPAMLADISGVCVQHDFCYLGSPYATELFLNYFRKDFKNIGKLHELVEQYPSQNRMLADKLQHLEHTSAEHIFVGNGATEIIQAVLTQFAHKKILVPVPTFSPYLEFAPKGARIIQHHLQSKMQFRLNLNEFLADVTKERPDTVVIINPNNPDGGYIEVSALKTLLRSLHKVATVIIDESFIHFASKQKISVGSLVTRYPNLIVIKSLSKNFGIAGLRVGYAVMSKKRVSALLAVGYLWNVSGFGEYFLELLNRGDFLKKYEQSRLTAIYERDAFFKALSRIRALKVYRSKANFFLIELMDGSRAEDLMIALLVRHGMYIRPCTDKVGLHGQFVRIASRKGSENKQLVKALEALFPSLPSR